MKQSRRLALRRETLTELTNDELTMAGANAVTLTLQAGCSADDVNEYVRDLAMKLTLHCHCSWSCI